MDNFYIYEENLPFYDNPKSYVVNEEFVKSMFEKEFPDKEGDEISYLNYARENFREIRAVNYDFKITGDDMHELLPKEEAKISGCQYKDIKGNAYRELYDEERVEKINYYLWRIDSDFRTDNGRDLYSCRGEFGDLVRKGSGFKDYLSRMETLVYESKNDEELIGFKPTMMLNILNQRGFIYDSNDHTLISVNGTTGWGKKCVIHPYCMVDSNEHYADPSVPEIVKACRVELERFSESGTIDDKEEIIRCYVKQDELLSWLDRNGYPDKAVEMKKELNKSFRDRMKNAKSRSYEKRNVPNIKKFDRER